MTLTFELDLDLLLLDLPVNIQVYMSVCLESETDAQTIIQTHDVETVTPVADAGCKDFKISKFHR